MLKIDITLLLQSFVLKKKNSDCFHLDQNYESLNVFKLFVLWKPLIFRSF